MKQVARTFLAIAIAILLPLGGASCDQPPVTAPGPMSPAPGFLRLELMVPESIAPGESVQLRAQVVKFDNSVEAVTGLVQWASSNRNVLEISSTGVARGVDRGEALIEVRYQSRGASTSTFVLPPGTYRLTGTVTDSGIGLPGVSVRVVDGVGQGLTTATNENGTYALYGVRDRVRLQAKSAGFFDQVHELDVADHRILDFEMRLERQRTDVHGIYRLTIDRNPARPSGCTGTAVMPPQSRSYDATVDQDGARLTVTLSDADFIVTRGRGNTFNGVIDGNERVTFVIGQQDLYYWEERVQDLVERISGAQHVLVITGNVTAGLSPSRISGTLLGWFLWVEGGGPPFRIIPNSCYIYTTHRFEMVRR
ncbi:MAG: carboxypeptidase regulatory-like domain-containing protein [Vicinamibacterales bacterium]